MAYQSQWIDKRDQILSIAAQVKTAYPAAWEELKVPHQKSREFINRVSMALIAAGIPGGVNQKRGTQGDSIDALAFPNASGAKDATGTYAGVEIIDIVGGAEGPNPSLGWGDVTQVTIDNGVPGGWKAGTVQPSPGPTPTPVPTLKPREQFYAEFQTINEFYGSQDGLKRPGGMVIDSANPVRCDHQAMGAWGYDLMAGKTVEQAIKEIRHSDEWKSKHPGETP